MQYSKNSSDDILIKGCQQNNRLAQKCLYEKYYKEVFGIGLRYGSNYDEAADIINQGFLKVFKSIEKFEHKGSFKGWLKKIMFNTAIDYVRKHTAYKKATCFNVFVNWSISNNAVSNLAMEELMQIIQQLPTAMRSVFCLYVIDGYKHREIGELLNISTGTSKWYLSKARKALQALVLKSQEIKEVAS